MDLKNAVIIDVRTPEEFETGHIPNSINIPLHTLPVKIEEIKTMKKPIVFCCLSGNRSGQAVHFLKSHGISDIYNGGGWEELNREINNL